MTTISPRVALVRAQMDHIAARVATLDGFTSKLVNGPFDESDKQLVVKLPNGACVSIMVDADFCGALYEIASLDGPGGLVGEKLTSEQVVAKLGELGTVKA